MPPAQNQILHRKRFFVVFLKSMDARDKVKRKQMNIRILILIVGAVSFFGMVSCYKTPDFPIEPTLEFDTINVSNPYQALTAGSMFLKFTDGDGDLGLLSTDDVVNVNSIFIKTVKYNKEDTSNIPYIPKRGTSDAISGTIEIKLGGTLSGLIDEADLLLLQKPLDTLVFDIYIRDRAGHNSNVVTTPPLVIKTN